MQGIQFLLVILLAVLLSGTLLAQYLPLSNQSIESKEEFSSFSSIKCPVSAQTYLNSVDPDSMQGSGTASKSLDNDNTLTIYLEANLPLAVGGNFNNENVVYRVFHKNTPLMHLTRHNDGFYKGTYTSPDSTNDDFNTIDHLSIIATDEKGDIPILLGTFAGKYFM